VAVVAGILALAAFPIAATISACGLPRAPGSAAVGLPPLQRVPTAPLRDVPVFTPGGTAERAVREGRVLTDQAAMRRALDTGERSLLGPAATRRLDPLIERIDSVVDDRVIVADRIHYPFRLKPQLAGLLDGALPRRLTPLQRRRANDLAGLLILAAGRFHEPSGAEALWNAAPVAFALLERARPGGGCRPQLNLGFLLSTDSNPRDDDTRTELRRAARACPGDPTPLWLLGEFQSHRAFLADSLNRAGTNIPRADRLRRPFDTFRELERAFPGSPAGWSGQADAEMRLGYQQNAAQPFTARAHFQRALALYRRALALDPDPDLEAGQARALAGLGRAGDAVALQRRALAGRPGSTMLSARLVDYLERARRFADAAAVAGRLTSLPPAPPRGAGLFPQPNDITQSVWDKPLGAEDGQDPLSLGATGLRGVSLHVGPGPGGADALVVDLSFIPTYHEVSGVTGTHRWCPGWSRPRDLLLAGHPAAALAGLRGAFTPIRDDYEGDCPSPDLLAAVADLDRGRTAAALRRLDAFRLDPSIYPGAPDKRLATIEDARQDLFRFAGDLPRAAAAVDDWRARQPHATFAVVQAGEIAFLRGDRAGARDLFAAAAARWRRLGRFQYAEADARLKEGTAASLAGDAPDARRALARADGLASGFVARLDPVRDNDNWSRFAQLAYHARVQAGDAALRQRRWALGEARYRAARDLWNRGLGDDALRPEALANNQAVAEIQLHRPAAGLAIAQTAVLADPANPIFLMTRGFAEQRLDRERAAERTYARAAALDPTLFPAENDLGVLRARRGDDAGAVRALRRALGAHEDYAIGWFNLGVVLERMGPSHVLSSQGALARAARIDTTFRGREHRLVLDDLPYFTGLDLSKPLPPDWRFAQVQRRAPVAVVGLVVILLVGLRLTRFAHGRLMGRPAFRRRAERLTSRLRDLPRPVRVPLTLLAVPGLAWTPVGRTFLFELFGGDTIQHWLRVAQSRWRPARWLQRALPAALAVAVTVAVLLWPLLGTGPTSWIVVLLLALGLLVLIGVLVRARHLAARRSDVSLRHYGWTPSLALGVGATAAGLGWAPVPVSDAERPLRRLKWLAPAALIAVAGVGLVLAHTTGVPITRSFASWALLMAGSVSTPIQPLDGAGLAESRAAVLLNTVMFGLGLAVLLGF
jgi:tetratricopeptide (TPR) repeat protein